MIAEQMDFAVIVAAIEKSGDRLSSMPGVILIDPWFVAGEQGMRVLRSFVSDLPAWILPLLVLPPRGDSASDELATQVRDVLGAATAFRTDIARRAIGGIQSLEDFAAFMPILAAEAERQYLRHGPSRHSVPRVPATESSRPGLASNEPRRPALPPDPDHGDLG
jgi:hypothetical protein